MHLRHQASLLLARGVSGHQCRERTRHIVKCAMSTKRKVAVIGAGAAGLVSARELLREGHEVVVFEQGAAVGGVWVYDSAVDSDVLGTDAARTRVHSSMYQQLRTNLPREIMGYSDFPFDPRAMQLAAAAPNTDGTSDSTAAGTACTSVDSRQYCGHSEVLRYLRAFAAFYGLEAAIRFHTRVVSVTPVPSEDARGRSPSHQQESVSIPNNNNSQQPPYRWHITTAPAGRDHSSHPENGRSSSSSGTSTSAVSPAGQAHETHEFDAVVVANGHYSEPRLPDVKGMATCPALQMHSHSYRSPEQFAEQVVLVVGASNSGEDISREVSTTAQRVLLCARSWQVAGVERDPRPYGPANNIYRKPMVVELTQDQTAAFEDGSTAHVDAVIYCTGFVYNFPFLQQRQPSSSSQRSTDTLGELQGIVTSRGSYVAPLYLHMFPPAAAPWLSFVGLPWKIVPFPQCELQAKLIARALSGRVILPSEQAMEAAIAAEEARMQEAGVPERYYHMQNMAQFAYNDMLADMCGPDVPCLPAWRQRMYVAASMNKRTHTENYRDVWPDQDVLYEARDDLNSQLVTLQQQVQQRLKQAKLTPSHEPASSSAPARL